MTRPMGPVPPRTRERFLRAVHEAPGVTLAALQERLGLAWSSIYHQLDTLEREGFVRVERDARRRRVYPAGGDAPRAFHARVLRSGTARRVALAVVRAPGCRCGDIAAALGLPSRTVRYHLERFAAEGLLHGARTRYDGLEPAPTLRELLASG